MSTDIKLVMSGSNSHNQVFRELKDKLVKFDPQCEVRSHPKFENDLLVISSFVNARLLEQALDICEIYDYCDEVHRLEFDMIIVESDYTIGAISDDCDIKYSYTIDFDFGNQE